jgi:hypothetical protein
MSARKRVWHFAPAVCVENINGTSTSHGRPKKVDPNCMKCAADVVLVAACTAEMKLPLLILQNKESNSTATETSR